ncbi:MAG: hypothetical protein ACP5VE_09600 [Chthonomonadales bacterium]
MNSEQIETGLRKGLEIWTLQNMADGAILLCFVILALIAGRGYLQGARRSLSLRVASEVWDLLADYTPDVLLFVVFLIGVFVTNLDIMADIKLGLPFIPLAFALSGAALVIRAFHNGRTPGTPGWRVAFALIAVAAFCAWFGFTFIMEAAGEEYFTGGIIAGPWSGLMHLRSDLNPALAETTFRCITPLNALVAAWATIAAAVQTLKTRPTTQSRGNPSSHPQKP